MQKHHPPVRRPANPVTTPSPKKYPRTASTDHFWGSKIEKRKKNSAEPRWSQQPTLEIGIKMSRDRYSY